MTIGITTFICVTILLTRQLKKYFLDIASVISKCDQIQLSFEKGAYLENETIYPAHWKNFGKPDWKEPIFEIAFLVLPVLGIVCIATVWFI